MEWLSNFLYNKKEPKTTEASKPNQPKFFYGTGPDDSLNDSLEATDKYSNISHGSSTDRSPFNPDTSCSSKSNSSDIIRTYNKTGWRSTDYIPPFFYKHEDFAQIAKKVYKVPLIIRLYYSQSGARAQIGNLENVLMTEITECYHEQQITASNLLLIIQDVNETTFPYYEEGLTRILKDINDDEPTRIIRCVLWMDCYYHAVLFSKILSSYCCSLLELNIGARRRPELPLKHPPPDFNEESSRVVSLLESWLLANMLTLRCLRVYTAINLDTEFTCAVDLCRNLRHLTISKIININSCCEFSTIRTVELDKQGLGYTDKDFCLIKKMAILFPIVKRIKISGSKFSPLVETLIKRLGNIPNRNFEIFQEETDIEENVRRVNKKTNLQLVSSRYSEPPSKKLCTAHFKNETYQSNILIHGGIFTYRTDVS